MRRLLLLMGVFATTSVVAISGCKPFSMRDIQVDSPAQWTAQESLVFWRITIVDRTKTCYGSPVRFRMRRKAAWGAHFAGEIRKTFTARGQWTQTQDADTYQGLVALRTLPDRYRLEAIQIRREYAKGGWITPRTWLDITVKPSQLLNVTGLQMTISPRRGARRHHHPVVRIASRFMWSKEAVAMALRRYPQLFAHFKKKIKVTRFKDNGPGVRRNSSRPDQLRRACLRQKHRGSCIIAGAMYQKMGGAANMAKGRRLLARACSLGDARGCWISCKQKIAVSCNQGGLIYYSGRGVKSNKSTAASYFKQGCDLGSPESCNRLGVLYTNGTGVAKSPVTALSYYRKACKVGFQWGCHNVGVSYEKGLGVAMDKARAAGFFRGACKGDNASSCNRLGMLHHRGTGAVKSTSQALKLFERSCQLGKALGCYNAGFCYDRGQGVARDPRRARSFYQRACKGGHKKACTVLQRSNTDAPGAPADRRPGVAGGTNSGGGQGLLGIPQRIVPHGAGGGLKLSALKLSPSGMSGTVRGTWGRNKPGILVLYIRAGTRTLIAFLDAGRRMIITGLAGQRPRVITSFSGSGYKRKGARLSFNVPRSMGGVYSLRQSKLVSVFMLPGTINPRQIPGTAGRVFNASSNVLTVKR